MAPFFLMRYRNTPQERPEAAEVRSATQIPGLELRHPATTTPMPVTDWMKGESAPVSYWQVGPGPEAW
jgi:hypothetical protein